MDDSQRKCRSLSHLLFEQLLPWKCSLGQCIRSRQQQRLQDVLLQTIPGYKIKVETLLYKVEHSLIKFFVNMSHTFFSLYKNTQAPMTPYFKTQNRQRRNIGQYFVMCQNFKCDVMREYQYSTPIWLTPIFNLLSEITSGKCSLDCTGDLTSIELFIWFFF